MSIRTTVSLDEDVLERVKEVSKSTGASFKDALNNLLRSALAQSSSETPKRNLRLQTSNMGYYPHLNYDDIEGLIEYAEGPWHR
ncbi:MAG: ribbon-helix-helix domain-containing protein [Acidobacteriota bacterium]|nr:ribbon-helix-helix domain-containing protein [Acidobacteriota bacterium]